MKTRHKIVFNDSRDMKEIPPESVDLMVTSPPYPMIEMWDEVFSKLSPKIKGALEGPKPASAYELMHRELDKVWGEVWRVLKSGGIACINIGDATRTMNGGFGLYTNHARIISRMQEIGFTSLPAVIWRKQTNAPNKFMGSGMLPPSAYVTLEHEYILVFRKGSKAVFPNREMDDRRESAYFWEERNHWFSDVWMDLKGTPQKMKHDQLRSRSGAFPFELPFRLINMFSVKGATVLDPFLGTGTTMLAAMVCGRNSLGVEIDGNFKEAIVKELEAVAPFGNAQIMARLANHEKFVRDRIEAGGKFKYTNHHYGFPVITNQERNLLINDLVSIREAGPNEFEVEYDDGPQKEYCKTWDSDQYLKIPEPKEKKEEMKKTPESGDDQLNMFD